MATAERRVQGSQRVVGLDLLQRGQSGLARAGIVVVERLRQRRTAAAALGLAQPLRGLDPLRRTRILRQHPFQAFPCFVLGQSRQRVQRGG